jgi:hypothetical protein
MNLSEKEIFKKTLNEYLKVEELKKQDLIALDAMCGYWHYKDWLFKFLEENYGCKHLLGVDIIKANSLTNITNKNYEFKQINIKDLGEEYDESFDLITNFRPQCYLQKRRYKPAYQRLNELLKNDGLFFGTTYENCEIKDLIKILKRTGFEIKGKYKNKFDPQCKSNGWIVVAVKHLKYESNN